MDITAAATPEATSFLARETLLEPPCSPRRATSRAPAIASPPLDNQRLCWHVPIARDGQSKARLRPPRPSRIRADLVAGVPFGAAEPPASPASRRPFIWPPPSGRRQPHPRGLPRETPWSFAPPLLT